MVDAGLLESGDKVTANTERLFHIHLLPAIATARVVRAQYFIGCLPKGSFLAQPAVSHGLLRLLSQR